MNFNLTKKRKTIEKEIEKFLIDLTQPVWADLFRTIHSYISFIELMKIREVSKFFYDSIHSLTFQRFPILSLINRTLWKDIKEHTSYFSDQPDGLISPEGFSIIPKFISFSRKHVSKYFPDGEFVFTNFRFCEVVFDAKEILLHNQKETTNFCKKLRGTMTEEKVVLCVKIFITIFMDIFEWDFFSGKLQCNVLKKLWIKLDCTVRSFRLNVYVNLEDLTLEIFKWEEYRILLLDDFKCLKKLKKLKLIGSPDEVSNTRVNIELFNKCLSNFVVNFFVKKLTILLDKHPNFLSLISKVKCENFSTTFSSLIEFYNFLLGDKKLKNEEKWKNLGVNDVKLFQLTLLDQSIYRSTFMIRYIDRNFFQKLKTKLFNKAIVKIKLYRISLSNFLGIQYLTILKACGGKVIFVFDKCKFTDNSNFIDFVNFIKSSKKNERILVEVKGPLILDKIELDISEDDVGSNVVQVLFMEVLRSFGKILKRGKWVNDNLLKIRSEEK